MQRSKREHKPTSKFLSYKTQEFSPSNNESSKNKKTPEFTKKNHPSRPSSISKQAAIHGRRKLSTDKVEVLCVSSIDSSPDLNEKSPEIRRTNRQHKPNSKLKEYLNTSRSCESVTSASPKLKKVHVQNPLSSKKFPETENNSDDNIEVKPGCSKFLSVGLVDCFDGLTKDLAKNYPTVENNNLNQTSDKIETPSLSVSDGNKRGQKRSLAKDVDKDNELLSKQSDEKCSEPLSKKERLTPAAVRNLTKTKRSTRVTTVVETLDLVNNKRRRTITQNKRLKVTKQYPSKTATNFTSSSKNTKSATSELRRLPKESGSPAQFGTPKSSKNLKKVPYAAALNQPKDIRHTLKKFLIMGTKVANAISETLKHNEEALLSKSSAFEKKCLSLVHALAKQGADLEEDDMEKVLKLLDEEQEERRIYRHTFLESLRVSHLTNMALYSQMLRLLKTL